MKRTVLALSLALVSLALVASLGFAQTPTHTDPESGTNPKTVTAYQIQPIKVDGDLSDWPSSLEKRTCEEFYPGYQVTTLGTSTQDNWFMVGWNDQANQVYIAGWTENDINVSQLSKWNEGVIPADTWFYDRLEIYVEWDNDDTGAYGYAENGNVQYAIVQNDIDRTGGEYDTSQEMDANGNFLAVGTAFWITNLNTATLDGRPPYAQAKWIMTPKDPNNPFGPYTSQFEMAFKVLTYLEIGVDPVEATDTLDIGPTVNDSRGIGFDVTLMDRDGDIATMATVQGQGAWIGWSSGSKNGNPQLDGTMMFSNEFKEITPVGRWELY